MNNKISKADMELLSKAVDKIISTEVLEKSIIDKLPLIDDLSDTNKTYCGKISVLFVDMRESTKLPEMFSSEQLVKIYRSYIRTVVQAIRYSGGMVRDFMGDGVLAIFVDDEIEKSEDKAIYAARYITTVIDKVLNPKLEKEMRYRISCGIGVHTGEVSLSKVGMKGKEQDDEAENEFGIAWIGNSTNLACKYSGAVDCGTIFISDSTYAELTNIDSKQNWESISLCNGKNNLKGYIAKQYYLDLDEEVEAYPAPVGNQILSLSEQLKDVYRKQLDEIAQKSEELGKKEKELELRELELNNNSKEVSQKENANRKMEKILREREYLFFCDVLGSGHCKSDYVNNMGMDFWEEYLQKAIEAGKKIGKDEHTVKQEISFVMVSIYENLQQWEKAYEFLIEQVLGCSWLHLFTVQEIVRHVGYCERLKSALYTRICRYDLPSEEQKEFEKIKNWLVFEYKK